MAEVWTDDRQDRVAVETENLTKIATRILRLLRREGTGLSIVVTDAEEIQRYNREYLGRDRPTNVISFPMMEGEPVAGDASYLGDVVLSVDAAEKEARELGYTLGEMLLLYLIHGILHLSGYDHEGVAKEKALEMERKQAELFDVLAPLIERYPLISSKTPA